MFLKASEVIANARRAFDAGELQIQKDPDFVRGSPSYNGPCAIGVSIPSELRSQLDGNTYATITSLKYDGIIQTDNLEALQALQDAHDEGDIAIFEKALIHLEAECG